MGIKHVKVSAIADAADSTKVRPSDWNTDHTIDGDVDFNGNDIVNCGNFGASAGLFTSLGDVPNSYAGAAGKVPAVNSGESGLEFVAAGVGGGGADLGWVTPMQFGAVADGDSHHLSEFYGTLAEAQAAYDGAFFFATSLGQEIDYCACKAASNLAFGPDTEAPAGNGTTIMGDYLLVGAGTAGLDTSSFYINDSEPDLVPNALVGGNTVAFVTYFSAPTFVATSQVVSNTTRKVTCATAIGLADDSTYAFGRGEHGNNSQLNRPIFLPAGIYKFGSDTWTIRNLRSGIIEGAGRLVSVIRGDYTILAFDGIWYSSLRNFSLLRNGPGTANTATLEIDGLTGSVGVNGVYATRGVQGNHFEELLIAGGGGNFAVAMCRQGGNSGQGSENTFVNCHLSGAVEACYYQLGFNALANTFIGGNFQDYTKHGAYFAGGSFGFFCTGFQSTQALPMVQNGGWDIYAGVDAGSFGCVPIYGCRTESLQFFKSSGFNLTDVRCTSQAAPYGGWPGAGIHRDANSPILWGGHLYYTLGAGTTGGSEPTFYTTANVISGSFPDVTDNDLTWRHLPFTFVEGGNEAIIGQGSISITRKYGVYNIDPGVSATYPYTVVVPGLDGISRPTEYVTVDATYGDIDVYTQNLGRFTINRVDNVPANMVTIHNLGNHTDSGSIDVDIRPGQINHYFGVTWWGASDLLTRTGGGIFAPDRPYADETAHVPRSLLTFDFVESGTSPANYFEMFVSADGGTPALRVKAQSDTRYASDTNIDLKLEPLGAGVVQHGTHSAIAAETVTGYITIKDSGGTVRKLAVVS